MSAFFPDSVKIKRKNSPIRQGGRGRFVKAAHILQVVIILLKLFFTQTVILKIYTIYVILGSEPN